MDAVVLMATSVRASRLTKNIYMQQSLRCYPLWCNRTEYLCLQRHRRWKITMQVGSAHFFSDWGLCQALCGMAKAVLQKWWNQRSILGGGINSTRFKATILPPKDSKSLKKTKRILLRGHKGGYLCVTSTPAASPDI